jgi:hypothetical protein
MGLARKLIALAKTGGAALETEIAALLKQTDALIAVVGELRRAQEYGLMERITSASLTRIENNEEGDACLVRSRVYYELHMAAYQRSEFALSLALAILSAEQAQRGGDRIGELFAHMNISGLLLPNIDRHVEGLTLSERTAREAEILAKELAYSPDGKRALRVAMNCRLHQVTFTVHFDRGGTYMRGILDRLNRNAVYLECQNEEDVRNRIEIAEEYIRSHPE